MCVCGFGSSGSFILFYLHGNLIIIASELPSIQDVPISIHLSAPVYIPGTQMTLVLIAKDLVLEGSTTKIEDKQVPG